MDILAEIVEVIYEKLSRGVATAIFLGVGLVIGIAGLVWHSSLSATVTACSSLDGRFAQLFNGSAMANCGLDSLLSKVAVGVAVIGFLIAAGFGIAFLVLASRGKLGRPSEPSAH